MDIKGQIDFELLRKYGLAYQPITAVVDGKVVKLLKDDIEPDLLEVPYKLIRNSFKESLDILQKAEINISLATVHSILNHIVNEIQQFKDDVQLASEDSKDLSSWIKLHNLQEDFSRNGDQITSITINYSKNNEEQSPVTLSGDIVLDSLKKALLSTKKEIKPEILHRLAPLEKDEDNPAFSLRFDKLLKKLFTSFYSLLVENSTYSGKNSSIKIRRVIAHFLCIHSIDNQINKVYDTVGNGKFIGSHPSRTYKEDLDERIKSWVRINN